LRPTNTAVANMPTRMVERAIRRAIPGRFLAFLAALATGLPLDDLRELLRYPARRTPY
jgi:hypothetical protein